MANTDTLDTLTRLAECPPAPTQRVTELRQALADDLASRSNDDNVDEDPLRAAIAYSLNLRGKHARGVLTLLIVDAWGCAWQSGLDCACAVEMVHTASLIIDDLPSMDDADMRRGRTTNHHVFSEPTALLAGIALLSEAFGRLAESSNFVGAHKAGAISALAAAVGPNGMTGGQQRDLFPPSAAIADIELTHAMKTGALFAAAAELGCLAAGIDDPRKWMLSDFGMLLGKAFQECDDLLDTYGDEANLGKATHKDKNVTTIVDVLGRDKAERHALHQVSLALECLDASGIDSQEIRNFTLDLTRTMRSGLQTVATKTPKD